MISSRTASGVALARHVAMVRSAASVIRKVFPQVKSLYLVGASIRGKVGADIDFVGEVPSETKPDQVTNISLLIKLPGKKKRVRAVVDVFFASRENVKATVLHYGLGKDIIRWKKIARSKGYKLNRYGLWKGQKRITGSPAKIALILGTNLKPFIQATLDSPI